MKFLPKCLAIQLNSLGDEHPVARTCYKITNVYDNKVPTVILQMCTTAIGDYDKAMELHEKCLAIQLNSLGDKHPDVAATYNNMAKAYYNQGDYDKAMELYEKCLAIRLNSLGDKHPSVATTYNNMADVYYIKGDYDKAMELYEKCLAIRLNSLGDKHPNVGISDVADTYDSMAIDYKYYKGDYDKAIELYEKCLAIRIK